MTQQTERMGMNRTGIQMSPIDSKAMQNVDAQSLHAIVTAELSDKAGWETLVALADEHGLTDMVDDFTDALNQEREHLALVQTWYEEAIGLTYGDVELDAGANSAGAEGTEA